MDGNLGKLAGAAELLDTGDPALPPYRDIVHVPGLGARLSVCQRRSGTYRQLNVDQATLILVMAGNKRLEIDGHSIVLSEGQLALIAPGTCLTVTNITNPAGGYRAEVMSLDAELVGSYAGVASPALPMIGRHVPDQGFVEAFQRARLALGSEDLPLAIRRHMLGEVLLRLGADAAMLLRRGREEAFELRLRRMVAAEPARDWSAAELSRRLAVSEATMRRRLSAVGTTLTAVIADVRMAMALTLLQSTDRSVTAIAFDVGYASPSRFAARFRVRFGCSPLDLRGGRNERIGMASERLEPEAAE